jgi:predicted site-specific integrase-resolvase
MLSFDMKLSQYAKTVGVSYKTAYRWWKAGKLDAYQLPSGTVVVQEDAAKAKPQSLENAALYCRVSPAAPPAAVEQQLNRLRDFASAKGYKVSHEVIEVAGSLDDKRPRLNRLLADTAISIIVVEYKNRLARYGFHQISQLLELQGRRIEIVSPNETEPEQEVAADFLEALGIMVQQLYRRRKPRPSAEQIRQCLEQCLSLPPAVAGEWPTQAEIEIDF